MDLQILGLNGYEEKVYTTLVNIGCSSAGKISEESGVPQGKIYVVLSSLEQKGLVQVVPEKTKKFQASSPDSLLDILKSKKEELANLEKEVSNLKETYKKSPKEAVSIAKGRKNFYKVIQDMPLPLKYEYDIKYTSELRPEWIRELNSLKKRNGKIKILTRCSSETEKDVKDWLKYTENIRRIENEGVAVAIIDDKFMFITMINSDVTLSIRDEATIKLFRRLFEKYYESADKI